MLHANLYTYNYLDSIAELLFSISLLLFLCLNMHEVGFEPTKLPHQSLSLTPLTAREPMLAFSLSINYIAYLLKLLLG